MIRSAHPSDQVLLNGWTPVRSMISSRQFVERLLLARQPFWKGPIP
jgi:hypothetical protein